MLSISPRTHTDDGLGSPWAASSSTTGLCSWKPRPTIRPQNSCCLQAWFPWTSSSYLGQQAGPRAPAIQRPGSPELWLLIARGHESLRALTACKLGSPVAAAAAVASRSPCPSASRLQGLCCFADARRFKPSGFAAPWQQQLATQCQEPTTTYQSVP
jgi:hypothetical protein